MSFNYAAELHEHSLLYQWDRWVEDPLRVPGEFLRVCDASISELTGADTSNPHLALALGLELASRTVSAELTPLSSLSEQLGLQIIREDVYRFSLRALAACGWKSDSASLWDGAVPLSFLVALELLLSGGREKVRRHDALLIFLGCLPTIKEEIIPALSRAEEEISGLRESKKVVAHEYIEKCWSALERSRDSAYYIIEKMRLSDYRASLDLPGVAQLKGREFDYDTTAFDIGGLFSMSETRDGELEAATVEFFQQMEEKIEILDARKFSALPPQVRSVLNRVRGRYLTALDTSRARGAAIEMLEVSKCKELERAQQHWERARQYLEGISNRQFRVSQCWQAIEEPLDLEKHKRIRQSSEKLVRLLANDAISRRRDLNSMLLEPKKNPDAKTDSLCLVRRWSSSHPLVAGEKYSQNLFGGGIFLYLNGFGVAIDPGPDFLSNLMFYTPFEFSDINAVVVTHSHVDHNGSVDQILSLGYERRRNMVDGDSGRLREQGIEYVICEAEPDPRDYLRMRRRRCKQSGKCENPKCEEEGICLNREDGVSQIHFISEYPHRKDSQRFEKELSGTSLVIEPIRVVHRFRYNDKSAGLTMTIANQEGKKIRIGYTSDTAWFDFIPSETPPKSLADKLEGCDILVANIGAVTWSDLCADPPANHLGLSGVVKLLNRLEHRPDILILNEWAAQNAAVDYRLETARSIRSSGSHNWPECVLVAEVGLRVAWDNEFRPKVYAQCSHGISELRSPNQVNQEKTDPESLRTLIRTSADCSHDIERLLEWPQKD